MTLAIEEMARELEEPSRELVPELCAVTGVQTFSPVPLKSVFSDTFCDWDLLAAPSSAHVDARIAQILGNGYLRWSSWIWTPGSWRRLTRWELREMVLSGMPPAPRAIYAAPDMRRHGGLLTHVSSCIQFGRHRVEPADVEALLSEMIHSGLEPRWIRHFDPNPGELVNTGKLVEWHRFAKWAEPYRRTIAWDLALFLLSAKPGEDADGEPQQDHDPA